MDTTTTLTALLSAPTAEGAVLTSSGTEDGLKVHVMDSVFNDDNIKKRVDGYVDKVYCATDENRKIRKAFRNQLYETIKSENRVIMDSLRVVQRKPPIQRRKRRRAYRPTPYVMFCREMKLKHPNDKLAGKIQEMWRNSKSTFNAKDTEVERREKEDNERWMEDNFDLSEF